MDIFFKVKCEESLVYSSFYLYTFFSVNRCFENWYSFKNCRFSFLIFDQLFCFISCSIGISVSKLDNFIYKLLVIVFIGYLAEFIIIEAERLSSSKPFIVCWWNIQGRINFFIYSLMIFSFFFILITTVVSSWVSHTEVIRIEIKLWKFCRKANDKVININISIEPLHSFSLFVDLNLPERI